MPNSTNYSSITRNATNYDDFGPGEVVRLLENGSTRLTENSHTRNVEFGQFNKTNYSQPADS